MTKPVKPINLNGKFNVRAVYLLIQQVQQSGIQIDHEDIIQAYEAILVLAIDKRIETKPIDRLKVLMSLGINVDEKLGNGSTPESMEKWRQIYNLSYRHRKTDWEDEPPLHMRARSAAWYKRR